MVFLLWDVELNLLVFLQLDFDNSLCYFPFKFNPTSLMDEDFNLLVHDKWVCFSSMDPSHLSPMNHLAYISDNLKSEVIY